MIKANNKNDDSKNKSNIRMGIWGYTNAAARVFKIDTPEYANKNLYMIFEQNFQILSITAAAAVIPWPLPTLLHSYQKCPSALRTSCN